MHVCYRQTDGQTDRQTDRRTKKINLRKKKGKGKGKYIYIALIFVVQGRITQFYLRITPCPPLPRKRSPDGSTTDAWWRPSNCSVLLTCRPRKDERLSWPSWLTYSGRFTHINGHPSAVGRAQDRETSPVKDQDQCSSTVPHNQQKET